MRAVIAAGLLAVLLGLCGVTGCGGDEPQPDPGITIGGGSDPDLGPDPGTDAGPDADPGPDAGTSQKPVAVTPAVPTDPIHLMLARIWVEVLQNKI